MKVQLLYITFGVLIGILAMQWNIESCNAQLRLSFTGYSATSTPNPVGWFDETLHDSLEIFLPGMIGNLNDGSYWYFSFTSLSHRKTGYPSLAHTNAYYGNGCTDSCWPCYDLIAWLEPGEFFLGHQEPEYTGDEEVPIIHGSRWEEHEPTDFTHLKVVLLAEKTPYTETPSQICLNIYSIPIIWQEQSVPVEQSTWGNIKQLFKGE